MRVSTPRLAARLLVPALALMAPGCGESAAASLSATGVAQRGGGSNADKSQERRQRAGRAWVSVKPHIGDARRADEAALEDALEHVRSYIDGKKVGRGPEKFADQLLSISGKLQYMRSDDDEYREWVARLFERKVLSTKKLRAEIETATREFAARLDANDGELLMNARADVEGILASGAKLKVDLPGLSPQAHRSMRASVGSATRNEVGALVAGEAAVVIASRVVAGSGARLAAGGAAGGLSLGATVGVALAVELVIGAFDDSEENVAEEVRDSLDALAADIVSASGSKSSLRRELAAMALQRQELRARAIRAAIWREA